MVLSETHPEQLDNVDADRALMRATTIKQRTTACARSSARLALPSHKPILTGSAADLASCSGCQHDVYMWLQGMIAPEV